MRLHVYFIVFVDLRVASAFVSLFASRVLFCVLFCVFMLFLFGDACFLFCDFFS